MTVQFATLANGESVAVEVKEGHQLIPEDIKYLTEYYQIMRMMPEPGVQGFQVGNRVRHT